MKKLDKFILKAFLGPFIAILLVVLFILMLQFLWLYIDELVGKGLGLAVILEFLFWGICTILPLALPLATLLSSMMVVGSMAENNELMAIKASGVSLARVMSPLAVASFVITIAAFFAGNDLVPKAYNEIFTLRDDICRTKEEIKIPSGTFYEGIEGYIMRIDDQDDNGMMHGVMVYDHTDGKGNTALTLADSATIKMSVAKDYLIFTLYSGANYQETNKKQYRDTTLELDRVDFTKQELIIPLKNYSFEKSDSSRFGDQAKSMNIWQLSPRRDSLRNVILQREDNHYKSMLRNYNILLNTQLDTATCNDGKQLFESENYLKWKVLQTKADAYEAASENASRLSSDLKGMEHDIYEPAFYLSRSDIEYLKKFAQAIACFILFFIGAPLGALIRKGGLGTSAIVSVLFFVLYWVVDISGTKLARDGAINPFHGVFISAYVLIPIGAFLTWKAINDESIFNMDAIKLWWKRITSKVLGFFRPTRIVFMGTPEFAVESLDILIRNKYKVVGVVTVADKPSGRGLQVNESAVKKYAVDHNIPVLQPVKLKDPEFLDALKAWKADLFVVVAFRMLPEEVWAMPRLGTFNLHAALLPQYRGAAPINWAVINGERITGVTTFMIDKDIDTGGIIFREEHRIGPEDTAGDVHDALMSKGAALVLQTVEGIIQKSIETRVQRSFIQGGEVLKPAPKLTKEMCRIDWTASAVQICNLVRGLSPYPTAWTTILDGKVLKVFFARPAEFQMAADPGTVIIEGGRLLVACGNGAVELTDIQMEGKKRMDAKAFLAGFRKPEDCRCI